MLYDLMLCAAANYGSAANILHNDAAVQLKTTNQPICSSPLPTVLYFSMGAPEPSTG